MAHFNSTFHKASGALANGGIRHDLGEISVPPLTPKEHTSAKQRRLLRPNTIEEIRRKRKVKAREKYKAMSKKEKKCKRESKVHEALLHQENKMKKLVVRIHKERKRAVDFWRLWDKEKMLHSTSNINVHQIEKENIKDMHKDASDIIGEGRFGTCMKKVYRGHVVAVKYYNDNSLALDVEKEAMMINSFDHPGLPFVFGMNVQVKPYILVTEFYGIDGKWVTLANAVKGRWPLNVTNWTSILGKISEALSHIHSKGYIHGDIKSDNIVIRSECGSYMSIIIDFGKMKKSSEAKKYNLTLKEKEKYSRKYKHIAPEVVWGSHPKSAASDIYSLSQIISLVCFYHRSPELQKIAKQCINGTPKKRPSISEIISQLQYMSS